MKDLGDKIGKWKFGYDKVGKGDLELVLWYATTGKVGVQYKMQEIASHIAIWFWSSGDIWVKTNFCNS